MGMVRHAASKVECEADQSSRKTPSTTAIEGDAAQDTKQPHDDSGTKDPEHGAEVVSDGDNKEQIRLSDFLKEHCGIKPNDLDTRKHYIQRLAKSEEINLPEPLNSDDRKPGQPYVYYTDALLECWPSLRQKHTQIPDLNDKAKRISEKKRDKRDKAG